MGWQKFYLEFQVKKHKNLFHNKNKQTNAKPHNKSRRNCPSSKESFGTIQSGQRILNAVIEPEFKKSWSINKDQIEVCKDCEFRYICTDCRVFLQDSNNIYSKPLKCGYSPYNLEWVD